MFGLSRLEFWVLRAFLVAALVMAGFLVITATTWQLVGPDKLTCFFPIEFTAQQAIYAIKFCERSGDLFRVNATAGQTDAGQADREKIDSRALLFGPEAAVFNSIFLLAGVAFLLGVPVAIGDILGTFVAVTRRARYRSVSTPQAGLRGVVFFANRALVVAFLILAVVALKRFSDAQMPFDSSLASGSFLLGDFSALFGVDRPKDPLMCDMKVRRISTMHKFSFQCSVVTQPVAAVARCFVFLMWLVLVPTLAWFFVNSCSCVLLSIFEVRKFLLSLPGEAVEVSKRDEEEIQVYRVDKN